ncbi:MAG: hypothetical protein N2662_07345, partial [Bacteroidales bacterium]|nr:hypothetical protein [Bacteroidales bacterium]
MSTNFKKIIFLSCFYFIHFQVSFSQMGSGGSPILVGENPDSLAEYEIPGPNFSEINYIRNQQKLFQSKALMFAYNYE